MIITPTNANAVVNSCVGMVDPRGGPALSMPPQWNRQRQFFGKWWDMRQYPVLPKAEIDFIVQQTPVPNLVGFGDLLSVHAPTPSWWTVDLWGYTIARFLEQGSPAVGPASAGTLLNDGQRFTHCKGRVTWENTQFARSVDVDIGTGTRFSILANAVRVELLMPNGQGMVEVGTTTNTANSNNSTYTDGLIVDTAIGGSAYPCFAPLSNRYPTFTQTVRQLEETSAGAVVPINVDVPPAAKYLTIYPDGDPLLTPWEWLIVNPLPGPTAGALPIGPIPYDPATSIVHRRQVPQNVSVIQMPVGGPVNRTWTLVWELEL